VTALERGFQHDTDVLIRRVDGRLAGLRADDPEFALVERLAASLRDLVQSTTGASAADRARVRAAVHHFVVRRDGRRPVRSLVEHLRVVNEIARALGRDDLVVEEDPAAV
jgi:hypothetical protein